MGLHENIKLLPLTQEQVEAKVEAAGWELVTIDWPYNLLAVKGDMGLLIFCYDGCPNLIRYDHLESEKMLVVECDAMLEELSGPAQASLETLERGVRAKLS